jgi:hypothetical protein
MERAKPEQLTMVPGYIQHNVTIGEFIDRIEPACGADAARRLRALVRDWLHEPMPDVAEDSPIPSQSAWTAIHDHD